jgi:hypothetical protein
MGADAPMPPVAIPAAAPAGALPRRPQFGFISGNFPHRATERLYGGVIFPPK